MAEVLSSDVLPVACGKYHSTVVSDERLSVGAELFTATPVAQVAEGWQPIATAPKDGTEILIYTRGDSFCVAGYDDIFSAPWRLRNDEGLSEAAPKGGKRMTTFSREDLELVAKAIGISGSWNDCDEFVRDDRSPDNSRTWNPERDDGDSRRLQVAMGINLRILTNFCEASCCSLYCSVYWHESYADHANDKNAVARIAVLRCAVEWARDRKEDQ